MMPRAHAAVFGDPVAHSLSPAMHQAAYRAMGLPWRYLKIRVPRGDLAAALRMADAARLRGVNLTIPLKEAALPLMDRLTPAARRAGAVNTVTFGDGGVEGHSTDGEGFIRSLADAWRWQPRGARVVLLGAGGAARSVAFALAAAGARRLVIMNRTSARAQELAARLRAAGEPGTAATPADAAAWRTLLAGTDLLVNATSLGLHGEPSPVPAAALPRALRVADLIYNPPSTALLRVARARGCRIVNGEGMLVHQGALSLERWSGGRAPAEVMRRALRLELSRR